jgi:hypothetical protein
LDNISCPLPPLDLSFYKKNVLILIHYITPACLQIVLQRKEKLQQSSELLIIFLEVLRDPFVTTIEAASQSLSDTGAKLHKVKATEEGLLLGELVEYTAS